MMDLWEIYKASKGVPHSGDLYDALMGKALGGYSWLSDYETTPYLYRAMPNLSHYYNREIMEEVVGGTVAWNQLVSSSAGITSPQTFADVTFTKTASPLSWSISGTASGRVQTNNLYDRFYTIAGHKYAVILNKDTTPFRLRENNGSLGQTSVSKIFACTEGKYVYFTFDSGVDITGTTVNLQNVMLNVIDLTQMFGTTIADYIYSLEQANAGAGVAWFKKLFPKSYYAYNAGELMSVKALRHITRGFNAWDGEYAANKFFADAQDGTIVAANGYNVTDYIPVLPNTKYCQSTAGSIRTMFYDADKNLLTKGRWASVNSGGGTFTTPSDVYFVRFTITNANLAAFVLNLSWDGERDGEYEEYEEHVYELDPDLELRGIPKLSAGNDLYYDGDTYESDGTVTRKYGVVDLGSLNWSDQSAGGNYSYYTDVKSDAKKSTSADDVPNCICANYVTTDSQNFVPYKPDNSITISITGRINVKDNSYTTVEAFKSAMSGVYLVYELATPTTETAQPFTKTQKCDSGGTEEFVTSGIVSVGHKSKYAEK